MTNNTQELTKDINTYVEEYPVLKQALIKLCEDDKLTYTRLATASRAITIRNGCFTEYCRFFEHCYKYDVWLNSKVQYKYGVHIVFPNSEHNGYLAIGIREQNDRS